MAIPKISIIMPCNNSEQYVANAIESMLCQTFDDFEFLIVNDGSIDNTERIVEGFNDSRICYFHNINGKGNFRARNYALTRARGKYVCTMDSDDVAFPERLSIQFRYMENHPSVGLIGSWAEAIDHADNSLGIMTRITDRKRFRVALLRDSTIIHPTIFFRRQSIERNQLYYNESLEYASDYDFVSRCVERIIVKNLDQVLLRYRRHSSQISTAHRCKQVGFADIVRLSQMRNFRVSLTKYEVDLYLRLMRCESISAIEVGLCEDILNRLLNANRQFRLFEGKYLFEFFEAILFTSAGQING